jgi:hypothetical protein
LEGSVGPELSRAIDVKEVEAYLGYLRDIGVQRGIQMVAAGFSNSRWALCERITMDLAAPKVGHPPGIPSRS